MSLTLTPVRDAEDVWGRTYTKVFDVTFDSSYPLTNGYVINAQDVGLKSFISARVEGGNKASGAVLPVFDFGTPAGVPATSVIARLFLPSGGATAPATLTAPVVAATGGGTVAITNGAITAGAITVAAGATPVTSTAANGAGIASAANPTQATSTGVITGGSAGAVTAGIGKEVGNTTDVSSVIVRVRFFGK